MGCGSSSSALALQKGGAYQVQVEEQWQCAHRTLDIGKGKRYPAKKLVVKRSGWKTIRVFVSSTFKDFHAEREVLVKKVFPDLRAWCEKRRLQLIECDLRWGVPKDFTMEATLRACLGEIDRCYHDNIMPFFVNMTSERAGWIPVGDEIPDALRDQYKWIEGLSVTEMEIMHGAYRNDNPNALFLLRSSNFVDKVPEEHRKVFIDSNPVAPIKLEILKKMIRDRFPDKRVHYYDVEYKGYNEDTKLVELGGLEGMFTEAVFNFFKERIEKQYPLPEGDMDPYEHSREQHESFMKNRSECVIGRDDVLKQILDYILGIGNDTPLILVGGAGSGKSSLMAKVADEASTLAMQDKIKGGGSKGWHVFYHFVGAVPGSTELEIMLKRFLKEVGAVKANSIVVGFIEPDIVDCEDHVEEVCWRLESKMPSGVDSTAQMTCSVLNNPRTRPVILIVDALNQFDEEMPAEQMTWVPRKLAPHIRCIFSMIPDTPQHKAFLSREPLPQFMEIGPLDNDSKKAIVEEMLGRYNKRLDEQQMECLLGKTASDNPLWLSIACEELRVFGRFRELADKINKFPDGLLELEMDVLSRFERENGGELLVAGVCLLEVSNRGLLEIELLQILGDEDNLMPRKDASSNGQEKDDSKREKTKKDIGVLPAYKWAEVYRALKPFIRPFGESGEGRLDFYHRSLSKAVRRKYFLTGSDERDEQQYLWWHGKLVDFFETSNFLERKLELTLMTLTQHRRSRKVSAMITMLQEYPVHLIAIKDEGRLTSFLTDWEVFGRLYDIDFSTKLIYYWRSGSSCEKMAETYMKMFENIEKDPDVDKELLCVRYEMVSRVLAQGGRFKEATFLLSKAMAIERDELGARDENMAELYGLSAYVKDQDMRQIPYLDPKDLPKMWDIIQDFEKSIALRKNVTTHDEKQNLGRLKNRLAYFYSSYRLTPGGNHAITNDDAYERAKASIQEAIDIFKEINDEINVADCLITSGVVAGTACTEQLKVYTEALEMTLRLVGNCHIHLDRLYLNTGIYHEEMRMYEKAYGYFVKWHYVCLNLYGLEHPKTQRTINTLNEVHYKRIRDRLKGEECSLPYLK